MEYIEVARYKLNPGFSDAQLIAAEEEVRAGIIKDMPGYVGRELYKGEDNEWCLILRFDSKEHMDALLASLKKERHPSFHNYASMIDFTTMRMDFFEMRI
ncbi:MAG: antibiotic biosynthesis monooxygenase [Candidatus Limnocylindrales bacterium]